MYGSFNMVYHNRINFTKIHGTVLPLSTDHSQRLTEQVRTKTTTFWDTWCLLSDALFDVLITRHIIPSSVVIIRLHFAHETAVCRNTQISSNWDSRITRQLGYKHTFCQNVVSTIKLLVVVFPKNVTCLSAGILRIGHVFSVCCKTMYRWVMINCCLLSDLYSNKNIDIAILCYSLCAYPHTRYINQQIHLIKYNSWQVWNSHMFRHRVVILREWHPDAEISRSFTLVMNCILFYFILLSVFVGCLRGTR